MKEKSALKIACLYHLCFLQDPVMPSQEPLVDDDKSGEEVELPPEDPEETDTSRSPSPLCVFKSCFCMGIGVILSSICQRALLTVEGYCSTSGVSNVTLTQLREKDMLIVQRQSSLWLPLLGSDSITHFS